MEKSSENYILSATLDQFLESRMKKQMTDEMLWTEKVGPKDSGDLWFNTFQEECSEAVASIAARINKEDADMRSHVVMSIFMVAFWLLLNKNNISVLLIFRTSFDFNDVDDIVDDES